MSDVSAVLFANESFYAAFLNRDMKAMAALWSERGAVCCIHPGWNAIEGREDVLKSWAAILGNPNAPRIRCRAARSFVHGATAIVICYEVVEGGVLVATNVFVREQEGWRMVHHQAGPATTLPAEPDEPAPPRVH
jgi:ketosteroid isomerase-like protein